MPRLVVLGVSGIFVLQALSGKHLKPQTRKGIMTITLDVPKHSNIFATIASPEIIAMPLGAWKCQWLWEKPKDMIFIPLALLG